MVPQSDIISAENVIVLSDVHIDEWSGERPGDCEAKRQAFMDFLRWVRTDSGVDHLVINGDTLDIPQKDDKPLLPAYYDLLYSLIDIHRSGIGISYIIGNHDAGILGISAETRHVPFSIKYPSLLMRSGDRMFSIEHGHLLDAWLWAYVNHRLLIAHCGDAQDPDEAMRHFTECNALATVRAFPPAHTVANDFFASLQWEPGGLTFTDEETRIGISLMARDLFDDFADVRRDGEKFEEQTAAIEALAEYGIQPADLLTAQNIPQEAFVLFREMGDAYYSRIPWRRAAVNRLTQINASCECTVDTILTGHIHKIDHISWHQGNKEFRYYNDGCWKRDRADFLYIHNGEVHMHKRHWTDPLP